MTKHEHFDRYELLQVLGDGGMGIVYKAYDPVLERLVAIKTIRDDRPRRAAARSADLRQRLKREASLGKRLTHPNIVHVHQCICHPNYCYIVMEFVDGQSLGAHLKTGHRFAIPEIQRIMHQLLSALDYAHRHGVIHGDVKPGNLLLACRGELRVTDFGTAHLDSPMQEQPLPLSGTPSYMAPEQCLGLAADSRADIFSTGVILYQLLTGDKPFTGSSARIRMHNVLQTMPADPSRVAPLLPPQVGAVVLKALAKRPDERFATARAFDEALTTALALFRQLTPYPTPRSTGAPSRR
jgi:serine/threonine-protein kinase